MIRRGRRKSFGFPGPEIFYFPAGRQNGIWLSVIFARFSYYIIYGMIVIDPLFPVPQLLPGTGQKTGKKV
jgi:hypothetical protein